MGIDSNSLIACMCEGGMENAIINILLDNDMLCFSREQLLYNQPFLRYSAKEFEKRYLRQEYAKKITILRVIDSKKEKFKLSKPYQKQVEDVITIITAPEVEILLIIAEEKHSDYTKYASKMKPSMYCTQILKMGNVKEQDFGYRYFVDPAKLLAAIKEYDRLHRKEKGELSLSALLKNK